MTRILAIGTILAGLWSAAVAQTPLAITEDSLPQMSAGLEFHTLLHATGGAPPYEWKAADALPDGINLTADGLLQGRPVKAADEVTLEIMVSDSAHPAHTAEKVFHTSIKAALVFDWKQPPKVQDSRIDGSVKVSNGSHDSFDLTVVIVAVASDTNRATAIGYQHFDLKPGENDVQIPFGSTLPNGSYVIHADAVAEISAGDKILRQRLQSAEALQVAVGP